MNEKLVFFGKQGDQEICIKFATSYSKEAHEILAKRGVAPALHGVERLPGGWTMVVMDRIGKEYVPLRKKASEKIRKSLLNHLKALHSAGFVHGDVRNANVMQRGDGKEGCLLLYYDWAGRIGEVRYPMNVNEGMDLWRPEVQDGVLIKARYNIDMAEAL